MLRGSKGASERASERERESRCTSFTRSYVLAPPTPSSDIGWGRTIARKQRCRVPQSWLVQLVYLLLVAVLSGCVSEGGCCRTTSRNLPIQRTSSGPKTPFNATYTRSTHSASIPAYWYQCACDERIARG
jgi:hypothetical protein